MINSDTPDKLAEIIRDTWPNLFRPPSDFKPPSESQLTNFESSSKIFEPSKIGMDNFFNELYDRLQHTEQLSRKNSQTTADIQFADGIKYAQKLIRELRIKHTV